MRKKSEEKDLIDRTKLKIFISTLRPMWNVIDEDAKLKIAKDKFLDKFYEIINDMPSEKGYKQIRVWSCSHCDTPVYYSKPLYYHLDTRLRCCFNGKERSENIAIPRPNTERWADI